MFPDSATDWFNSMQNGEALLRTVAETVPTPIFVLNRDHTWRYQNPAALAATRAMSGAGLTLDALLGNTALETFGDSAEWRQRTERNERVMATGIPEPSEIDIPEPGGTRSLLVSRAPLRDTAGQVVGLVGVALDVTEQKQAEARRLADLARQRDALVREVHHRIKNHLHGVMGLLRLHTNTHTELGPFLGEIMGQIGAIAGVYGLQGSGAQSGAELSRVIRLIAGGAAGPVEFVDLAGAPLPLADADAVPVALVVNELVTNALKHRKDPDPTRSVKVTLDLAREDARLTVSASPARLPEDFDFAARCGLGTGLELVATLLPSRGARLDFSQTGDEVRATLTLGLPILSTP
jgi:PAS domain S-box-containing protein